MITVLLVDDQAYYVKRRLEVVKNNGLIGIVLVIICLLIFIMRLLSYLKMR